MRFETISKKPSGFLTILDHYLSADQRVAFDKLWPRRTFVLPLPNYRRLIPTPEGQCVWDSVPAEVIEGMRRGEADLVLDNASEVLFFPPYSPEADVPAIYAALAQRDIPPERLVLATGNLKAAAAHDRAADANGLAARMTIWSSDFVMAVTAVRLTQDIDDRDGKEPPRDETMRRFLFLNRKLKRPRIDLLMTLVTTVGFDDAYISLLGEPRPDERERLRAVLEGQTLSIVDPVERLAYESAAAEVLSRFPISLPESRATLDVHDYGRRSLEDAFYRNSYLSLVSETLIAGADSLVITEKTLKPIFHGHPFIVQGDAGTLERLRFLGFESFSPLIDETYDEIVHSNRRVLAVRREVVRIAAMAADELMALSDGLRSAVEHNRRHVRAGFRDRITSSLLNDPQRMGALTA